MSRLQLPPGAFAAAAQQLNTPPQQVIQRLGSYHGTIPYSSSRLNSYSLSFQRTSSGYREP